MKKFILIIVLCFICTACFEQKIVSHYKNPKDTLQSDAPMYDVLGRQVDATYRGIIIQNGNKYLLR